MSQALLPPSCGLVMKEDITQRGDREPPPACRCGLVMKEDITQPITDYSSEHGVVVW